MSPRKWRGLSEWKSVQGKSNNGDAVSFTAFEKRDGRC